VLVAVMVVVVVEEVVVAVAVVVVVVADLVLANYYLHSLPLEYSLLEPHKILCWH